MRRAQSVRNYARSNTSIQADDLGVVIEASEESLETALRRQLLEKDREVDRVSINYFYFMGALCAFYV